MSSSAHFHGRLRQRLSVVEVVLFCAVFRMHEPVSQMSPIAHEIRSHRVSVNAERVGDLWTNELLPECEHGDDVRSGVQPLELRSSRDGVSSLGAANSSAYRSGCAIVPCADDGDWTLGCDAVRELTLNGLTAVQHADVPDEHQVGLGSELLHGLLNYGNLIVPDRLNPDASEPHHSAGPRDREELFCCRHRGSLRSNSSASLAPRQTLPTCTGSIDGLHRRLGCPVGL